MFFEKGYYYDGICLTVIYRKRMTTAPSDSDNLTVRVRGYIDNVLSLDTVRVMHAFRKEEKIERSDYEFDIIF